MIPEPAGDALLDPARARALGARGRAAALAHFDVDRMAASIESHLHGVIAGHRTDHSVPPCPTNSS